MRSLHFLAAVIGVMLLLIPPCQTEFIIVMPDSSALVDAPQTGFSNRARTDPGEQQAVYDIMKSTGNGWATSIPDVCRGRWHGIECMPDQDDVYHVVSLSFGALSDDTAFPTCDQSHSFLSPSLLRLPRIRSLFFYRCFTANPQPIPAFLGQLGPALRTLVLRENGHVGPIPAELGNLTSLRVLNLHGNNLGSSIPASIGRLASLQSLDLSNNQLNGFIPDLSLPTLNVLDLSHNNLQGRIPATINQCISLFKLDMSRNHLTGTIPETLSSLKSLILLDLSHNWLSGPLPASLGSLTSLRDLILKGNSMTDARIPEDGFSSLKELITLVLSDMALQGPIPESIGQLPSLRVLHLDGNELNGSIPRSFAKLERLSELRVNNNRLAGPIPFGKEMVWRMGKKLRVYNNSGLCYDASNGGKDDDVSLSGVSDCKTTVAEDKVSGRTTKAAAGSGGGKGAEKTKHLSVSGSGGHGLPADPSSYASAHDGYSLIHMLVLVLGIHLCLPAL